MKTTVVLYEDNVGLRNSIRQLLMLSDNLLLLQDFGDATEVEKQVKSLEPDLILMDIGLPGVSGIEAVKKIRAFNKKVQIIMLTVFDDHGHVLDAICAGANGYILKKHISDKLITAIEEVMQGGAPMSPGVARMVIQHMQQTAPVNENIYHLTGREKEILTSLSRGNSFKLIAAELNISIDTVRTHIKRIYEKLQVHTQTEAVSKAVNEKLV